LGDFGCGFPDVIPKSFDPIFIKATKAAKKAQDYKEIHFLNKDLLSIDNKNIS